MKHEDYKHVIPLQIRFSDIDRLQHVNNSCYHNYAELGRVRYFNEVLKHNIDWNLNGFVLARTEIDHVLPVFLNDEIYCFTKVYEFGNKSIRVKNAICRKKENHLEVCANIQGVLVTMDYQKNESIQLPLQWRKLMTDFEKI